MAKRKRCFMEIEVGGVAMGKITMELFNDKCPRTCENFRALCTGDKGIGKTTEKPLHYLSSIFHRVVNGFMIQGGDFSNGNGTGGESIYGGVFPDEDLTTKHDVPFLLSMANRGKDTNGSQFFITTAVTPHLDGIHVVFGQIKTGEDIVKYIEGLPVDRMCRPMQDVKITRCGELVLKNKAKSLKKKKKKRSYATSSSSDTSDDEDVRPTKLSRKAAFGDDKIRESSTKKTDDEEDDDVERHPLVTVSKIDPADIPEIPSYRYLLRGSPDAARSRYNSAGNTHSARSSFPQRRQKRYSMVTKSGRHIKGRGKFRFRTPSPSNERSRERSRSATPPHWRQAQRNTIKMSEYKKKIQLERSNMEKDLAWKAAQLLATSNRTENGLAVDLERTDPNDKKETIEDGLDKNLSMGEITQSKQSVELVFVKSSKEEEDLEWKKPNAKNGEAELKNTEENPELEQESVKEIRKVPEEPKQVRKLDEEIVIGQPLDLNALDYEVTEFEQAESEHSIDNENEIDNDQCTEEKDASADAIDVPSADVVKEVSPEIPATQSRPPGGTLIDPAELENDFKKADSPKKEITSKPIEVSSKRSPKTSSSRKKKSRSKSRRSSSRTKRSSSRTKRSDSRTRKTRRGSKSSDRQRRRSGGRSSRHDRERKYDRRDYRHGRGRRSPSGDRRRNGSSSRRRKSSTSDSSSPSPTRRHRTRR